MENQIADSKNVRRIEASRPIRDFDNSIIYSDNEKKEYITVGQSICNILRGVKSRFDVFKTLVIGQKFATEEIVELDASDFLTLKETINNCKNEISNLILGRIMETLVDAEKIEKVEKQ